jgi:hypothetical protein
VSVRVTVRRGPVVERERFEDIGAALAYVERRGHELEASADAHVVKMPLGRDFEPVQQVVARIAVRGAGIDVRGDGSSEAWTGRLRRRLIEQRGGESAYDVLRRELSP